MSGRDQPGDGGAPEPVAGSGYTSNPYDAGETPAPYSNEPPTTRIPSNTFGPPPNQTAQFPTAQPPSYDYQPPPPNPTAQYTSGQYGTGQWGTQSAPITPPYGEVLPLEMAGPPGPPGPPPPRERGALWPWVAGAVGIFVVVLLGAVFFYMTSISSDLNGDSSPKTVAAPTSTSAPATTTVFAPRFVAISGEVQSNDGTTLVIVPSDGGKPVTVVTNSETQVLLGGGGVESFQVGDGVFVQGGEQEDGTVLARMIIGSMFGGVR